MKIALTLTLVLSCLTACGRSDETAKSAVQDRTTDQRPAVSALNLVGKNATLLYSKLNVPELGPQFGMYGKSFKTSDENLQIDCWKVTEISCRLNGTVQNGNSISISGKTAQEFYGILDLPELGPQFGMYGKSLKSDDGKFSVDCWKTPNHIECSVASN